MKPIPWNGLPISQSGIYSGIPIQTYHQQLTDSPSVSKTGLWQMLRANGSPAHYYAHSYLNPEATPFAENEAMILGRGAHHLLLGEADFAGQFVIRPETYPARDGTEKPWHAGAEWCKQWDIRNGDKTILKPDHIRRIRGMSRTLGEHPMIRAGILNGLVEHSLVYRDIATGIWVKVRPDVVPTDDLDVADLKTTVSVADRAIERSIADFGYYLQAGLNYLAFENVLGAPMNTFSLVFVESEEPFCVRVVTVKQEDIELGVMLAQAGLRLMARCMDKGVWPGPGGVQSDAMWAGISPFARQDAEYRLARVNEEIEAL
jgi:PDDEXK-like uncharacterized protein DUF3799